MPHPPTLPIDVDSSIPEADEGADEGKINECLTRLATAEEALKRVRKNLLDLCPNGDGKRAKVPDVRPPKADLIELKPLTASQTSPGKTEQNCLSPGAKNAVGKPLLSSQYASKVAAAVDEGTQGVAVVVKPSTEEVGHKKTNCTIGAITVHTDAKEISAQFGLTEEESLRCVEAFKRADADASGYVDVAELQKLIEAVTGTEMSKKEYKDLLSKYDGDADGTLDFQEFMTVFVNTPIQKMLMLQQQIEDVADDTRAEMELERMSPLERVQRVGVPVSAIKTYLRKDLGETESCFAFPWAVALFLAFVVSVTIHFQVDQLHAVDVAITFDIIENANFAFSGVVPFANGRIGHKNVYDVNTHADFWSWLSLGLVQIFWVEGFDASEVRANVASWCLNGMDRKQALEEFGWHRSLLQDIPTIGEFASGVNCPEGSDNPPDVTTQFYGSPPTATFLMYHSVVGGLRMRQEYSDLIECPGNDPELRKTVHSGECVGDPGYWLRPELRASLDIDLERTAVPGHGPVFLLSRWNRSVVRQELRRLENDGWMDPRTAKVELMLSTYNPHTGILTATFILFFHNRAGHIHKMIEPISMWLDAYSSFWHYFIDIVWGSLVLKIVFDESQEILKHFRQLGVRKGLYVYAKLSNAVDWSSVAFSIVIVAAWFVHCSRLEKIKELLQRANVDTPGSWEAEEDRIEYFDRVEEIARFSQNFRMLLALYPFIIVSRFFKAFSTQPRLAMVTNTLIRASVDIAHFSIVFASIFLIYTASAHIMFGQELLEFANFSRSINTVFRIMLGDYGWEDALLHVGRIQAGIWFWTFTWLVNLVLLNMLLAILMDVYTAVKGEIGSDTDTLISQTYEIVERMIDRHKGRALPLEVVLRVLDPTDLDTDDDDTADQELGCFTVKSLMDVVPGLLEPQSESILLGALKFVQRQERGVVSLTDATLAIQHIDQRTRQMHWSLENAVHLLQMNAGLILGGGAGRPDQQEVNRESAIPSTASRSSLRSRRSLRFSEQALRELAAHETPSLMSSTSRTSRVPSIASSFEGRRHSS